MTLPRKQLFAVKDTAYYPVVSSCLRRSYLCGIDAHSGKDYEHSRRSIENVSVFIVTLCHRNL
jgi:hypothetical protein